MPAAVYLLSLCNAYQYICASLLVTVSALIGFELAPDKNLATLPIALQFIAVLGTSVPASLFMSRFGRKAGFILGGTIGITGASLALWSITHHWFAGFCLAAVCFGSFTAFANYYRFTAAEVVDESHRSRAISLVMAGGVLAAFIGPNLANWSSGLFSDSPYAGPFAVLVLVYAASVLTAAMTRLPTREAALAAASEGPDARPLGRILRQPVFLVAVVCQMFGYGTMNLVMTATPLAMQHHHYGLGETALVIQWHVLAMFAPSFFTGHLIARLGMAPVLLCGAVLGLACVALNLHGQSMSHFVAALVFLGISWNFLFVGGTTLLTRAYHPVEKARVQAANDVLVFGTVSITALSAGSVHHLFGWQTVNMAVIPLLVACLFAAAWLTRHRDWATAPAA